MLETFLSQQPLSSQSFGEALFFPGQLRLPLLGGLWTAAQIHPGQ